LSSGRFGDSQGILKVNLPESSSRACLAQRGAQGAKYPVDLKPFGMFIQVVEIDSALPDTEHMGFRWQGSADYRANFSQAVVRCQQAQAFPTDKSSGSRDQSNALVHSKSLLG
jgi:hypothetical protein